MTYELLAQLKHAITVLLPIEKSVPVQLNFVLMGIKAGYDLR
jgi:hypothetical protein